MPKYYTPKRPAIRFANSGSAMQAVSVQRVERIIETPSDQLTENQDFSGVPRFPRRSFDSNQSFDTSSSLARPLAFGLGATTTISSGAQFTRYSWLPQTSYLKNQQTGIYGISAASMGVYSSSGSSSTGTWTATSINSSSDVMGTVILEIHPTASNSSSEVLQWNAYLSGNELIEGEYGGLPSIYSSSAGVGIFRPTYYSKTSVDGGSTRTIYAVSKLVPSINDLVANPPATAPSASSGSAPTLSGTSISAPQFKAFVGLIWSYTTGADYTGAEIITRPFVTYIPPDYTAVTATIASSASLISALSGNLIYIVNSPINITASVISATLNGEYLTMSLNLMSTSTLPVGLTPNHPVLLHSWVPLVDSIFGTYVNNSLYDPAAFSVPLTQSGRIRDIRAWVEFVHDYRTASLYQSQDDWGLQGVQVSLRSPNTSFYSSHPLWNNNQKLPLRTDTSLSGVANRFADKYYNVPELLKNSYLLWQGHGCDDGVRDTLKSDPADVSDFYHEFDRDIDMRTIFWDGSSVANPRDISGLYPSASAFSTGTNARSYDYFEDLNQNNYQSPTWGAVHAGLGGLYTPPSQSSLTCSDTPWMLDTRIDLGAIEPYRANALVNNLPTSPPGGWLTGRGGMLPWLPVSNSFKVATSATNDIIMGEGDRTFIRPTKNLVYVVGGKIFNGVNAYVPATSAWYTTYYPEENRGILNVDNNLTLTTTKLPGDANSYMAVSHFLVTTGSVGINDSDIERVIMVGGKTNSGVSSQVWVGHWVSASNDITWVASTALPSAICQHNVYVTGNHVYVSPGLNASTDTGISSRITAAFSAEIDQQTGLITGGWVTHNFPGTSIVNFKNVFVAGSGNAKSSISTDNGQSFTDKSDTSHNFSSIASGYTTAGEIEPGSLVACSRDGYIAESLDSGSTWTWQVPPSLVVAKWNDVVATGLDHNRIFVGTHLYALGYPGWAPPVGQTTDLSSSTRVGYTSYNLLGQSYISTAGTGYAYGSYTSTTVRCEASGVVTFSIHVNNNSSTSRVFKVYLYPSDGVSNLPVEFGMTASAYFDGTSSFSYTLGNSSNRPIWDIRFKTTIMSQVGWVGTCYMEMNGYATSTPPQTEMNAVCVGPNSSTFVAVGRQVGHRGCWKTTDGGNTWVSGSIQRYPGTYEYTETYNAVIWTGDKYIAGGTPTNIVTSSDGLNWGIADETDPRQIVGGKVTGLAFIQPISSSAYFSNGLIIAVQSGTGADVIRVSPSSGSLWWPTNSRVFAGGLSDVIWTGDAAVVSAPSEGVVYSYNAWFDWFDSSVPTSYAKGKLAFTTGSYVVGSNQPLYTFFDTLTDATGSPQSFAWTTFDIGGGSGDLNGSSVLSTFRYPLTSSAGAWAPVNDSAIEEVNYTSDYYPTIVDNSHRAWAIGTPGFSARYSTISWDVVNNRPRMSAGSAGGVANNKVLGIGSVPPLYGQFRSAATTVSGIMATGLGNTYIGYGGSDSINALGVTAMYGVGPAANEFNTFGYQLGPASIRPVLPMLEDVYAYKLSDETPGVADPDVFRLASNRSSVIGYRPGLRNTEVSGNWNFLFGTSVTHSFDVVNGYNQDSCRGIWVRQVRIETVIDRSSSLSFQNPSRERLYKRSATVPSPDGPKLYTIESGSAAWDIGLVSYQTYQFPEYGRTVSITSNTSSVSDAYAVLTYITGNLFVTLSESGITDPWWFLGANGFGTPYIPDTYMSLGTGTAEQIDAAAAQQIFDEVVNIQKTIPDTSNMAAQMNSQGVIKTKDQLWQEVIASQTASSTDYFGL